jgi:hypothetical protein
MLMMTAIQQPVLQARDGNQRCVWACDFALEMEYALESARVSTLSRSLGSLTAAGLGSGPSFPDTTDLVAYWAFDGTSTSRTETEAYKGYDRHGDSTFYSSGTHPINAPGYSGNGVSGVDGFYTSGLMYYNDTLHGAGSIDKFLFTGSFTCAFWIYSPSGSISSWSYLQRLTNTNANSHNWMIGMSSSAPTPGIYFWVYDSVTTDASVAYMSPGFSQGAWHHIICEYDHSIKKSRIQCDLTYAADGVALPNGPSTTNGHTLRCAEPWDSYGGSSWYHIDEWSIWSRLLTSEEKSNLAGGVTLSP